MIRNRQVFYLDSGRRLSGDDASNCTIKVDIPHVVFTHVCVVEASIPKSYYLIQAGFNTFTVVEGGNPRIITLTPACYSATAFRLGLAAQLNAGAPVGWTYALTMPGATAPQTGKWTYTVTGNAGSQPSFVTTTNVYEQLGFNANSTNTFVGDSLTSTNMMKLQSEDALYIHSDIVTAGTDDILQEIYTAGVPDLGIIKYTCPDWQIMAKPITGSQGNSYRFTLTDENARVMNMNGLNWVMTLMVFTQWDLATLRPPVTPSLRPIVEEPTAPPE
jgi:hypothetical protein